MERFNLIVIKFSIVFAIISIVSLIMVEVTAKSLAQTSWLVFAIAATAITVILGFFQVFKLARALGKKRALSYHRPLKVTLEVNGDPITIESSDTEQIADLLKLIQSLQMSQSSHTQTNARNPIHLDTKHAEKTTASLDTKEQISSAYSDPIEIKIPQKLEIDE